MIKMCSFYKSSRKCINKDYCVEQLPSDENCCTSNLYYCMDLEQQNKQMKEALEKIVLIYPKYNRCINNNWKGDGDGSMCKHCNTNDICPHLIAQQAIKGVE